MASYCGGAINGPVNTRTALHVKVPNLRLERRMNASGRRQHLGRDLFKKRAVYISGALNRILMMNVLSLYTFLLFTLRFADLIRALMARWFGYWAATEHP